MSGTFTPVDERDALIAKLTTELIVIRTSGEKLFRAIGHAVNCRLLHGPECTCGHAKLQAEALDEWVRSTRP
jgi:hypothetical protein